MEERKRKVSCGGREFCIILIVVIVVCLGLLLSFYFTTGFGLIRGSKKDDNDSSKENMCTTEACVSFASSVLSNLDTTVNPCDDFYQFSCGNWIRKTVIPEEKSSKGVMSDLVDNIQLQVKELIERDQSDQPLPVQLVATRYKSCMNEEKIESLDTKPLLDFLDKFGGWPVVKSNLWSPGSFDVIQTIAKLTHYDYHIFISANVEASFDDSTLNVMLLLQGGLGLPTREYFLESRDDPKINAYEKYAVEIATLFGAYKPHAAQEIRDMIDFEMEYAKIIIPKAERRSIVGRYRNITISELYSNITSQIEWLEYFNVMMSNINKTMHGNFSMIMYDLDYYKALGPLLSRTDVRTLANYIMWRVVMSTIVSYPKRFREESLKFKKSLTGSAAALPRWRQCVAEVSNNMGYAVGRMYMEKHFTAETKKDMKAMKQKIGYPDFILDDSELIEIYQGVVAKEDTFFDNIQNRDAQYRIRHLKDLGTEVDERQWRMSPVTFNAYYDWFKNEMVYTAAFFQRPLYDKDYPKYVNFAGIGSIVGHEISHGFDDQGRLFNEYGDLVNWWTPEVETQFKSKADCMKGQYNNYVVPEAKQNINGLLTLGENIADNGGLKVAYNAYMRWKKTQRQTPPRLPALDYNDEQLFFLSLSQFRCIKVRPETALMLLRGDYHSPQRFRVNGPLHNTNTFAQAFNCGVNSAMNPENKCHVW